MKENLATVRDPVLREKLTPNYAVGCKRLVMSPGFYEAVQKPGCVLVTEGIDRVVADGLVTKEGRLHALDVVILATGFDPQAYFQPMKLTGLGGRTIEDVREKGRSPIARFSPVGNVCAVLIAEWQAGYILQCLAASAERKVAISADAGRTADMISRYREETRNTVWYRGGCQSWYLDRDGFPILYPSTADRFEREMKTPLDASEYVLLDVSVSERPD